MSRVHRNKLRLPATITLAEVSFDHDHECYTALLQLQGEGWSQAFGGVMRSREQGERFLATVQRVLGSPESLVGTECIALYADVSHVAVTGIESPLTAVRFCLRDFDNHERQDRKSFIPSPAEKKREELLQLIERCSQQINRAARDLARCDDLVDWSTEPPTRSGEGILP